MPNAVAEIACVTIFVHKCCEHCSNYLLICNHGVSGFYRQTVCLLWTKVATFELQTMISRIVLLHYQLIQRSLFVLWNTDAGGRHDNMT